MRKPLSSNEIDWELYRSIAASAARKVARSYPGVSAEDIEQTIYVHALENEPTFKRMNYGPAALFAVFTKYGVRYANDERRSALHFSDQYHYTAKEIRKLCSEALFDREAFMDRIAQRDELLTSDPEEVIARVLDLQAAYAALMPHQKALLTARYVDGATLTGTQSKEVTRVIDRLSMTINIARSKRRTEHDGPGARKAMSNHDAANLTRIMNGE